MPERQVRELAAELAERLEHESALDPTARDALHELRNEIDRAVAANTPAAPTEPPSAQARTMIERLEKNHPELTAIVQRIADALSAIGL